MVNIVRFEWIFHFFFIKLAATQQIKLFTVIKEVVYFLFKDYE
jgi:hypothetical protein